MKFRFAVVRLELRDDFANRLEWAEKHVETPTLVVHEFAYFLFQSPRCLTMLRWMHCALQGSVLHGIIRLTVRASNYKGHDLFRRSHWQRSDTVRGRDMTTAMPVLLML